jgi:hypothetical protein
VFCRGDVPVIVFDKDGKFLDAWGKGICNSPHGIFIAPHGLWCDSDGDLYVGEVILRGGAVALLAPLTPHAFQKFRRSGPG